MANSSPSPQTRFIKGGPSPNPGGRPKNMFSRDKLKVAITKFLEMTKEQVEAVVRDPETTMIDLTVASILVECIKKGDYARWEALLSRCLGKVKEEVELSQPAPYVIHKLDGSEVELGSKIEENLEE